MRLNRNSGLAFLLIAVGSLILLNKMGVHTGHLMSYLFPVAMIGLGWIGIKNNRTFIGLILIGIGSLVLIVKLSGVIAVLIAIGLIACGISSLKRKSRSYN
jgi:lia operon protein LiaI